MRLRLAEREQVPNRGGVGPWRHGCHARLVGPPCARCWGLANPVIFWFLSSSPRVFEIARFGLQLAGVTVSEVTSCGALFLNPRLGFRDHEIIFLHWRERVGG